MAKADLENRVNNIEVKSVRRFLRSIRVECLDDVTCKIAHKHHGFWTSIGVKKTGHHYYTNCIKSKLAELKVFSSNVDNYDKQVRKRIIKKTLNPAGFNSYYLDKSLEEDIWKNNFKVILNELKKRERIEHLDDITTKIHLKYCGFWKSIYVKKTKGRFCIGNIKDKVFELGFFSPKIRDYNKKARIKIIEKILKKSGSSKSWYINRSLDKNIWYDNIRLAFDEFKKRERIEHLDDITDKISIKYNGFLNSISVKKTGAYFRTHNIKNRLIELGLFGPKIDNYEKRIKKKIIEKILCPSTAPFNSYYIDKSFDEHIWKDNIKLIFNELKKREGLEHLDDIDFEVTNNYKRFWSSIGVKKRRDHFLGINIKTRLVELGLFSARINDYSGKIKEKIIEKSLNPPTSFKPHYTGDSIEEEIRNDNIKVVFNELRKREGIEHLDDITGEISREYKGFWNSICIKKTGRHFKIDDIKNKLIELGFFSPKIRDYNNEVKKRIVDRALNPSRFNSYYINNSLDKEIWHDNIKLVFDELKKREGIEHLDDITNNTVKKHYGFWNNLRVIKTEKNNHSISKIKTYFIHLSFFNEDLENKYGSLKVTGTALDLLKKLDCSLFGYKDLKFNENNIDKSSYLVFKKVYKEAKHEGVKLNNALELFEYYNKKYSTQKG